MLAVLPAALLLFYVYKLDPVEKEPPKLLGMLLLLGAVSVIPAVILEILFSNLFLTGMDEYSFIYLVIDNFFGVALIEELCKFVFLRLRTWKHPAFTYVFDGIVYAVFVSLGFAIAENIMYVFEYGFGTAVMRAFTAIPGHCVFAVFMGYLYGEAKYAKAKGKGGVSVMLMTLALVVAVLAHGLYDLLASMDSDLALILFFVVLAGMVALGLVILKVASKEQKCIYPSGTPFAQQVRTQAQPQSYPQHPYVQQRYAQPQQPVQQQYTQPQYQQHQQPTQPQYGQPQQQPVQQQYQQQPVQPQYQQQHQQPVQQQYGQPAYPQQPVQQQYQQPAQPQYGQQQYGQPQPQQPAQQQYGQPQQSPYPQRPQSDERQ